MSREGNGSEVQERSRRSQIVLLQLQKLCFMVVDCCLMFPSQSDDLRKNPVGITVITSHTVIS